MLSMPTLGKKYHHGDLRRALITEGTAMLAETGPAGLSLREVARRLGVSHNAPYRHFATRDALLAAISAAGYDALAERTDGAAGDMAARGLAYIAFALEHPPVFRLMFSDLIDRAAFPELAAAANGGLERASRAIGAAYGDKPEAIMAAWSFVHGLALLLLDGQAPGSLRRGRSDLTFAKDTLAAMAAALA
jgi:AcrR family transcriptional regulator